VRRRETVSVGHDRGRARGRHIYRDAAHGHAAHIAHKRPLRPRRACELSRGGAGGAHTATPCESRGRWGFSGSRGGIRGSGVIHASGPPPDTPVRRRCDAGRPPAQAPGGRRRDPYDAGGACADSHSGRGGETVSVGYDGGRARGRHIYRAAAHGHAAHIAHTRSLRPDAPVSFHRQGGAGGGTHSYPVREPRPVGGFSGSRGGVRGSGVIHASGPPPGNPVRRSRG
jgi:hypothetical protein